MYELDSTRLRKLSIVLSCDNFFFSFILVKDSTCFLVIYTIYSSPPTAQAALNGARNWIDQNHQFLRFPKFHKPVSKVYWLGNFSDLQGKQSNAYSLLIKFS